LKHVQFVWKFSLITKQEGETKQMINNNWKK